VTFKPSYDSYALHTLSPVWQRCTPVYTDKWVYIITQPCALCIRAKMLFHHSLLNDALQRKDALHHSHRTSRR